MLENEGSDSKKVKKLDVFKKLDVTGLAKELGRSISAPPPGLFMEKGPTQEDLANPFISDPAYAEFYYSIQPLDPRLPKPQAKPANTSVLNELRIKEKLSIDESLEKKRKSLDQEFQNIRIEGPKPQMKVPSFENMNV